MVCGDVMVQRKIRYTNFRTRLQGPRGKNCWIFPIALGHNPGHYTTRLHNHQCTCDIESGNTRSLQKAIMIYLLLVPLA